jgi:RimJ/RimL family protein N-acetyltransferase
MTERLILRGWEEEDREPLAAMHADPEVMEHGGYPAPLSRAESGQRFEHYQESLNRLGYGYLVVRTHAGDFLGHVGISTIPILHRAVGEGVQIGWFLVRRAWGHGYATEAAKAALMHGFSNHRFAEVLSYTDPNNTRSQAVMKRLGMLRLPSSDFSFDYEGVRYSKVVYAAYPPRSS